MDKKSTIKTNVADASQEQIQARIFTIRGEQVMLDRDLAMFYGVETRRINERVKRNKPRFPEDFCFQLTNDEWESLRSQNETVNKTEILISQNATSNRGGVRKLPFAFTEGLTV